LNSRERVLRALEHTTVDMIPYWGDFTSIESQMKFFGEKFFEADPFTQSLFQAKFLNSDIITLPVADFPVTRDVFTEKLDEGADYVLSKNPFGGIHYTRKKPYFVKILHSPVRTREDLDSIPPFEMSKYDAPIRDLAGLAMKLRERGYFLLAIVKGPFEAPWVFLRGLAPYMLDLARDPDFVTRMIEVSFRPMMDLAERVADEAPIDGVWVTDDFGESRSPFLSVEKYRKIYKPWHKELVDRLHKKQVKVFLHSHGNVMPLVGEFVDDGFDSFDPFDPSDNMHLPELKSLYGDRITLTGGITKQIGTMTPEEINQHIEQIVKTAGPNGLILECGGGIPPEMTLEHFMHYSAAIERFRRS
jgi:uroporphyrinogen-III decarboxylase